MRYGKVVVTTLVVVGVAVGVAVGSTGFGRAILSGSASRATVAAAVDDAG